jgi:hypothetical protein
MNPNVNAGPGLVSYEFARLDEVQARAILNGMIDIEVERFGVRASITIVIAGAIIVSS